MLTATDINRVYRWLPGIRMALLAVPNTRLHGDHIMVGSDYSGCAKNSKYLVYSFLIMEESGSSEWRRVTREWRRTFLPDGRRMSFKALNDGCRRWALKPYLCTFHYAVGCSVTIAVHKSLSQMSGGAETLRYLSEEQSLVGNWRQEAFEQATRIAQLYAILIGHFSRPMQDVTWLTDQDEVVANDDRLTDMFHLVRMFTHLHVPHKLGIFAMNTSAYFEEDRFGEDVVALPDLVAGALAEYLSVRCESDDWHQRGELPLLPELMTPKTEFLCSWLEPLEEEKLSRSVIIVDRVEDGRFRVKNMLFGSPRR